MIDYNDGKWYGWNGGKCPVHPKSVVEVRSWAGCTRKVSADLIRSWDDDLSQSQPIVFRVIKEYKTPREVWIYYVDGQPFIGYENMSGSTLFREVRDE